MATELYGSTATAEQGLSLTDVANKKTSGKEAWKNFKEEIIL